MTYGSMALTLPFFILGFRNRRECLVISGALGPSGLGLGVFQRPFSVACFFSVDFLGFALGAEGTLTSQVPTI